MHRFRVHPVFRAVFRAVFQAPWRFVRRGVFRSASRAAHSLGAAVALTVLLAGCSVYVVPGDRPAVDTRGRISISLDLDNVITSFSPVRGAGAEYRIGQQIQFRIRTLQDGYVTLTAIDPDGSVYVLARNLPVYAGTNVLPWPESRIAFVATPPTGLHRVRASFTERPVDRTRVRFQGRTGEEGWTSALRIELRGAEVRDVAETFLYVVRR